MKIVVNNDMAKLCKEKNNWVFDIESCSYVASLSLFESVFHFIGGSFPLGKGSSNINIFSIYRKSLPYKHYYSLKTLL